MRIGVVADDITGSNDIGIMFAKADYLTHVYRATNGAPVSLQDLKAPHVAILDTNSRLDTADEAYKKVFAATRLLREAGCRQFYNKTCSVFRGNIGAEFDAMLDALDEDFAVIVLGFPKNGRTTVDGIHYVHGKKLEDSEFRNDPIHPMTCSNLVSILQEQTERRVALLNHTVIDQGAGTLWRQIQEMRDECNYLILDVVDQQALRTIAAVVHDFPILCGSSALAEELPDVWAEVQTRPETTDLPPQTGSGVLVVAGSLMPQTRAQLQHLRGAGVPSAVLDPQRLFNAGQRQAMVGELAAQLKQQLQAGSDALLYAPNEPEAVEEVLELGRAAGQTPTEVARAVSGTLAAVAEQTVSNSDVNALVIAGGETSAAVCDQLGVDGLRIWKEIQPGLPSCISLTPSPLLLVLKSGSFGSDDFLAQAIAHLKRQ